MADTLSPPTVDPNTALALCQALADPTRFALMAAIWQQGERCVCDLQGDVGGQAQNLVSHHLGVLRRAGLIAVRREGRWAYYRPVDSLPQATAAALQALLGPRGSTIAHCE